MEPKLHRSVASDDATEVLYGRSRDLRMFVSSVIRGSELVAERAAATQALDAMPRVEPWLWERQGVAGPHDAREFCVRSSRTSDAVILIIGSTLTEVTLEEYEAAREAGAPTFVFLSSSVERDAETDHFVRVVREDHGLITQGYTSPADLAEKLTEALHAHFAYAWRSDLLARRNRFSPQSNREFGTSPEPRATAGLSAARRIDSTAIEKVLRGLDDAEPLDRTVLAGQLLEDAVIRRIGGFVEPLFQRVDVDVPGLSDEERAWVLNAQGLAHALMGRTSHATAAFGEMRDVGTSIVNARIEATALQNLALVVADDTPTEAMSLLARALEVAQGYGDPWQVVQLRLNQASIALYTDDLQTADDILEEIEPTVRPWGGHLLASVNGTRGIVAARRGQYALAERLFRRTLDSARQRQDLSDAVLAWQNLGATAADRGHLGTAQRRLGRAIAGAERLGWSTRLAELHRSLGATLFRRGDYSGATVHLRVAHDGWAARGDALEAARTAVDLGAALAANGDRTEAGQHLSEALGPLVAANDRAWEARALENLAALAEGKGLISEALALLERAGQTLEADDPMGAADLLVRSAALAIGDVDDYDRGRRLLESAIGITETHGGIRDLAVLLHSAGQLLSSGPQPDDCVPLFERAAETARAAGDMALLCDVATDRGCAQAYANEAAIDAALESFETAVALAEQLDDPERLVVALNNLGEIKRRRGDLLGAESATRRALDVARTANGSLQADSHTQLGTILADMERWSEADSSFRRALEHASDSTVKARARTGLGNIAFLRGDYVAALDAYDQARALYRTRDPVNYISTLGAMLESRIARGEQLSSAHIQRLVDRAQELNEIDPAIESLARCGRRALSLGDEASAISLYATACVLGGVGRKDHQEPEQAVARLTEAMLWPAVHLQEDAPELAPTVLAGIAEELVRNYDLPEDLLLRIVDAAHQEAERATTTARGPEPSVTAASATPE